MNIKDMLLGIAIGDAFGAGIEFQSRDWIKDNVDFTAYIKTIQSQTYNLGDYTDDAEMTIGLIKALLSGKTFTTELLVDYWKKEYDQNIETKGHYRHGYGIIKQYFNGKKTIEEVKEIQKSLKYPGNAPPMRAVPLGLLKSEIINEYALINAETTHPHPKARAASILVARAAEYMMVQEADQKNVINYCKEHIKGVDEETDNQLLLIDQLPTLDKLEEEHYEILCGPQPLQKPVPWVSEIKGLASDAMRTACTALYIIKHSNNTFTGLKTSINVGGDVDSLASICTGILAGRYGLETLPNFMIEQVEGRQKLEQLADEFQKYLLIH